jgi:hypothetical protein
MQLPAINLQGASLEHDNREEKIQSRLMPSFHTEEIYRNHAAVLEKNYAICTYPSSAFPYEEVLLREDSAHSIEQLTESNA